MTNHDKEAFRFTYSAKEQEELKAIREKYLPSAVKEEDAMARVRRLDRGVTRKAEAVALTLGIVGMLVMGGGMSLVMSELGTMLGLDNLTALIGGIAIGVVGMAVAGIAYPVYNRVLKKEREKIAPEILSLIEKTEDLGC